MNPPLSLLLVGCGKMGGALLRGILTTPSMVADVVDPHPLPIDLVSRVRSSMTQFSPKTDITYDVVIVAVKPQQMVDILPSLRGVKTGFFLSIAAGTTTDFLRRELQTTYPIVRAMPNLPASIMQGITGLYTDSNTPDTVRQQATLLMQALGDVVWLDDESHMNAVTAVSGSGPAYLFLLVEAMTAAGVTQGLAPDVAAHLARKTVIGASALLDHDKDHTPGDLRAQVTSPGGTTESALKILMQDNRMTYLMMDAIAAATQRSKDLSK